MFCCQHPIPHEDCERCLATVSAMRPTVFAELAAAELRAGTECCPACDYVYFEAVSCCPRCGASSLLEVAPAPRAPHRRWPAGYAAEAPGASPAATA